MKQLGKDFLKGKIDIKSMSSELRMRLVYSALTLLITTTIALVASKQLIFLLQNQMPFDVTFIQFSPAEVIMLSLKIILLFGVYTASPVILYNLLAYKLKKTNPSRKRNLIIWIGSLYALSLLGIFAGYYLILPFLFYFLLGFNSGVATVNLSISGYTTFCLSVLTFTGLLSLIPGLSYAINKFKLSLPKLPLKKILITALISSIIFIAPSELLSILGFSGMLVALYWLFRYTNRLLNR